MKNLKLKIKNIKIKFKIFLRSVFFAFSFLFLVFSFPLLAFGQTAPEFLVSWRASNYVPADYQGKILPSKNSAVEIGFDVIDKNKIADLSRHNINWFLGDNLIRSGVGLKKIAVSLNNNLAQA